MQKRLFETSVEPPGVIMLPKRRFVLYWKYLRGEDSIAELCRHKGINSNVYYRWSKEFLEAGKKRLSGDTAREATEVAPVL